MTEAIDSFLFILEKFINPTASLHDLLADQFPGLLAFSNMALLLTALMFVGLISLARGQEGCVLGLVIIGAALLSALIFPGYAEGMRKVLLQFGLVIGRALVFTTSLFTGLWAGFNLPAFLIILFLAFVSAAPVQANGLAWLVLLLGVLMSGIGSASVFMSLSRRENRIEYSDNMMSAGWAVLVLGTVVFGAIYEVDAMQALSDSLQPNGGDALSGAILMLVGTLIIRIQEILVAMVPIVFAIGLVIGIAGFVGKLTRPFTMYSERSSYSVFTQIVVLVVVVIIGSLILRPFLGRQQTQESPPPKSTWTPFERDYAGVAMVLVPTGCFMMGNDSGDYDERPAHEVCITRPFWIDKYEVSQAVFKQFNGQSVKLPYFSGENLPVEQISWFEAKAFCESRGTRLPTEAEWEYAARGSNGLNYPWGNSFVAENVVFEENSSDHTAPIGSRPSGVSWVGAMDLSGNVREWLLDWYDSYDSNNSQNDPQGPERGEYRVGRGGSWGSDRNAVRATYRFRTRPSSVDPNLGFRCARTISDEELSSLIATTVSPAAATLSTDGSTPDKGSTVSSSFTPVAAAATLVPAGTSNTIWTPVERDFNGVTMVLVPAGCFMMGGITPNNDDLHEVCITQPFWIDKYEVTNRQFGSAGTFKGDLRPRDSVNWYEAQQFCNQRNGARLPTEAEWEYAARGPMSQLYPWGNEWDMNKSVWDRSESEGTENIGSHPEGASWVGAQDMSGNVWEWVNDWWDESYYLSSDRNDPQGPPSGEYRVLRGGAWLIMDPWLVRSVTRSAAIAGGGDTFSTMSAGGFRCARSYQ